VPYLSASAVVIHYEEALYQVYAPYLTWPNLVRISFVGGQDFGCRLPSVLLGPAFRGQPLLTVPCAAPFDTVSKCCQISCRGQVKMFQGSADPPPLPTRRRYFGRVTIKDYIKPSFVTRVSAAGARSGWFHASAEITLNSEKWVIWLDCSYVVRCWCRRQASRRSACTRVHYAQDISTREASETGDGSGVDPGCWGHTGP